jgi:hypothetical protein
LLLAAFNIHVKRLTGKKNPCNFRLKYVESNIYKTIGTAADHSQAVWSLARFSSPAYLPKARPTRKRQVKMSKSERKQKRTSQSEPILFSENSELLPVTRQNLVTLREKLKREKLTPWLWFNFRGVEVTKFDGGIISILGVSYEQSQVNVFWHFIEPFLQDAIVNNLDDTLKTCHARGLKPEEPYIRETAMLLDGYLIDPIYNGHDPQYSPQNAPSFDSF